MDPLYKGVLPVAATTRSLIRYSLPPVFTQDDLATLARLISVLRMGPGERIITKGETATFCCFVLGTTRYSAYRWALASDLVLWQVAVWALLCPRR